MHIILFIYPFFFFFSYKNQSQISHLLEPESSNFVYTLTMVKYVVYEKNKMVMRFFFLLPISLMYY